MKNKGFFESFPLKVQEKNNSRFLQYKISPCGRLAAMQEVEKKDFCILVKTEADGFYAKICGYKSKSALINAFDLMENMIIFKAIDIPGCKEGE